MMANDEAGAATTAKEQDPTPAEPEFAEIENNLKPWAGEGKPPNLLMRLCAVMAEVGAIPKSGKHAKFQYPFSTIDDVVGAVRPLFAKHGIWPNIRVTARAFQSFKTAGEGMGYNGDLTYACSLFNAEDPTDNVTWEMAGLVTNPGEKLDWVAQSQFYKYFLLGALCLDRGNDDADSNPADGPRDISGAMRTRAQRSRAQEPQAEGAVSSPPKKKVDWSEAWKRLLDVSLPPKNDSERATRSSIDTVLTKGSERGWADDMMKLEVRRRIGVELSEVSWQTAERLAWIFGTFEAGESFVPPSSEEVAALSVPAATVAEPEQAETAKAKKESK